MFKNQYDTDVTTWTDKAPAPSEVGHRDCEAGQRRDRVEVQDACGARHGEQGFIGVLSYQKKLFKIDNHIRIAMARLSVDGRVLSRYMQLECINHHFVMNRLRQWVVWLSKSLIKRRSMERWPLSCCKKFQISKRFKRVILKPCALRELKWVKWVLKSRISCQMVLRLNPTEHIESICVAPTWHC